MKSTHVLLIIFGIFFIVFGVFAQTKNITINPGETISWVVPEGVSKVRLIYKRKDGSIILDRSVDVATGEIFQLQTSK